MIKILQKYIFVLAVVMLIANVAFAQIAGKSRLDIGKKQTAKTSMQLPFQRFVAKPMSKEVSINKNAVVNQYFRNSLLTKSSATPATSKARTSSNDVSTRTYETTAVATSNNVEVTQSADKLYASERITVSNIYPNPANDYAFVDFSVSNNVNTANLTFFNILGSEVGSFELDKFDRKLKIQTSTWESGIYFYQLNVDGKKLITKKLLVRHN